MESYFKLSEHIKMHKLSLRFNSKEAEDMYITHYKEKFQAVNRIALFISLLILILYTTLEFTVFGLHDSTLFTVKFLILLPAGVLSLLASFLPLAKKLSFYLYGFVIIVTSLSFSFMTLYQPENLFSPSLLGLIMFYMFAFALLRITFIRTFIILLTMYLSYLAHLTMHIDSFNLDSFSSWFFLGISFAFSAAAGYYYEYTDRNNYVTNLDLSQKNKQYAI